MCLCNPTYEVLSFICEILPTTLTNLFVYVCLEKIDPDKSKHVANTSCVVTQTSTC